MRETARGKSEERKRRMVRLGNLECRHGLLLAPMAGVSDRAFRAICREMGAEYTVSEMISAKALCYEQLSRGSAPARTAALADVYKDEKPIAVQLFGSEPEVLARAAHLIGEGEYRGRAGDGLADAIDLNMGCPVHKVVSNGEGSALMKDPKTAVAIVRAVCAATKLPVTVKIRAGWDRTHINAPEFARALEDAGAAMICVHARTREQMYEPGIDLSVIARVKQAVRIPVIGNGDIRSASDAVRMLQETECDGVMVGRGAMGNPWLFSEICAALENRSFCAPSIQEKMCVARKQIQNMVAWKGEHVGVAEGRKHLAWYIRDLPGAAALRNRVMRAETMDAFNLIIDEVSALFDGFEVHTEKRKEGL